jgi:tetratricopeptide (TPR) repeat protein
MSDDAAAQAEALHQQAMDLDDDDEALRLYHQALALDPARPSTLYNIGLIHKYRGAWAASLDYNRRALVLAPEDEAANWNFAIAATALCDWASARQAWQRVGIDMPPGEAPIDGDFGSALVRLDPDGSAEVVWGRRICPVRQRINNVPLPESGYRCGDIVLHDGAATGSRLSDGREYRVFNALMLHQPSALSTYTLDVEAASADDVEALLAALGAAGLLAEDWTASIHVLCKACSEGVPHEHDDGDVTHPADWQAQRRLGVAAVDAVALTAVAEAWAVGAPPSRRVGALAVALRPPTV